jgi:hypothetical protein
MFLQTYITEKHSNLGVDGSIYNVVKPDGI